MKPETRLAQWLMASVFIVIGGYRLWQALQGVPTSNATLGFSAAEFVLGLLIAAGWRLRVMAGHSHAEIDSFIDMAVEARARLAEADEKSFSDSFFRLA